MIIPAQEPYAGIPPRPARAAARAGRTPRASLDIVVDSPPGMHEPVDGRRARSGRRTGTGVGARPRSSAARCSRTSPCRARTPIAGPVIGQAEVPRESRRGAQDSAERTDTCPESGRAGPRRGDACAGRSVAGVRACATTVGRRCAEPVESGSAEPVPGLPYQPRSASRCGAGMSSTLMPTIASPRPRETLAMTSGSS